MAGCVTPARSTETNGPYEFLIWTKPDRIPDFATAYTPVVYFDSFTKYLDIPHAVAAEQLIASGITPVIWRAGRNAADRLETPDELVRHWTEYGEYPD
jgi:hypothetical protein